MKKLFIHSLLSFCCLTLFFNNLFSSTTPTPPDVTVPDLFDTDGDDDTAEPVFNADGAPLILYCENTDFENIPIATAQGEPGAIFLWYRDTDPLDDPDFMVDPPTGVFPVVGTSGPGNQNFNAGIAFAQSDSIYVIQNVNNCISDYTFIELIINDSPVINIPPVSLCYEAGGITSATITPIVVGGGGNYTYSWITPLGYTGPTNEAEITTSQVGTYILTVTDGNMCSATEITKVTAFTPPDLEIALALNANTCLGHAFDVIVNTTDSDQDDSGNYKFSWSISPPNIIKSNDITAPNATIFATTDNVTITVTVMDSNGCENTEDLEVAINPLPTFPSSLPEILVCIPDYISTDLTELDAAILTNVTNGTVTWYEGDPETIGLPITNPTNVNIPAISVNGIYAQITDNDTGCQNDTEIWVVFDDCTSTTNTLSDQYADLIKIFPNPFKDKIAVDLSQLPVRAERFVLYDVNGRAIKTFILNHSLPNQYDVNELSAGIYLYEILNNKNERLGRGKLLK